MVDLSLEFRKCLKTRKILKIEVEEKMVKREIEQAGYDLKRSINSLKIGDYKCATIQAYYSMFHSTRALIFSRGIGKRAIDTYL